MLPDRTVAPLIGRDRELERLQRLVDLEPPSTGAGAPPATGAGAVVVAGDAGVGKTRLLAELQARATDAGRRVVVGHCIDFGDGALPYLPFSEIFGRIATEAPDLVESLLAIRPAIRRLLPGARLLSGTDDHVDGPTDEPAIGHHIDRADLFEAVHAAFEQLGAASPLLVVVEDVHWADRSTREILSFLFARGFAQPVSVVVSYRTDDLHRRHPLRVAAAEWSRLPGVTRIQLDRLSDANVRTLVQTLHPMPMRERDVQTIVDRAEGNAFFAEELVVAADHEGLPGDLADLLLVRLDRLGDAERRVVRAAAVAGRRVSHELLARVVDLDDQALDFALRATTDANVLVSHDHDVYAFRHALLAEAVYDDLLPGERTRLHRAYVDALRSAEVGGTAAELARHARAANDVSTAVRASIEAGDDAARVGGPDEAAHHYERALALSADAPDRDGFDLVELTVRASEAVTAAGHAHRAVALVQDQLAHLSADVPGPDRARLLIALAQAALISDTNLHAFDATAEALTLVPSEPPTPLLARLLSTHARANADRGRDDEADHWARDALRMARALDLADVVADATTTIGRLNDRAGDPEASQRAFEEVIERARLDGDAMSEVRSLHHLAGMHFNAGELQAALPIYQQAADRAAEAGRPWAPWGIDARVLAGVTAYLSGDWPLAERIADVTGQSPPGIAEANLTMVTMTVQAGRGDPTGIDLLARIRPWWGHDGMVAIWSGGAAIDLYGDGGDLDAAIAVHDEVVEVVGGLWQRPSFAGRIRLGGLLIGQLGSHAERVATSQRGALVDRAEGLADAAQQALSDVRGRGQTMGPEGQAWLLRVVAELARLRWAAGIESPQADALVTAWDHAVAAFDGLGQPYEASRSRARLAEVLRAVGRRDEAVAAARRAHDDARRIGAATVLAAVRDLGLGIGDHDGVGSGPRSGGAGAPRRVDELTRREQEIVVLVAEGRSNGEIGRQLYISAKTVSVHVSNIMAKLGAASRTEAAAVARRRGLLPN